MINTQLSTWIKSKVDTIPNHIYSSLSSDKGVLYVPLDTIRLSPDITHFLISNNTSTALHIHSTNMSPYPLEDDLVYVSNRNNSLSTLVIATSLGIWIIKKAVDIGTHNMSLPLLLQEYNGIVMPMSIDKYERILSVNGKINTVLGVYIRLYPW